MLAGKDIETVLCKYRLLSEQGAVVLTSCRSLQSGIDYFKSRPKDVKRFLEIERQLLEIHDDEKPSLNQSFNNYLILKREVQKQG